MRPEEALFEFLREEARPKISKEWRGRTELERFILPGSNIHKFYFTPPQEPEILEDIVKTIPNRKENPDKVEIITQHKYWGKPVKKYKLALKDGKWLLSNIYHQCIGCEGKGCSDCDAGWLEYV